MQNYNNLPCYCIHVKVYIHMKRTEIINKNNLNLIITSFVNVCFIFFSLEDEGLSHGHSFLSINKNHVHVWIKDSPAWLECQDKFHSHSCLKNMSAPLLSITCKNMNCWQHKLWTTQVELKQTVKICRISEEI